MKKIILILLFLISYLNAKCICYYFDYNHQMSATFFKPTCENYAAFMKNVLNVECEIKPFAYFLSFKEKVDYLFIVGEGSPGGLFLTHSNSTHEDYKTQTLYKWNDLAHNMKAYIAVVDSCYPGYLFDYNHPYVNFLITTAYKENSWNIIDNSGRNVSSFSTALRCKYEDNYTDCPVATFFRNICKEVNINKCQAYLIIKSLEYWGWKTIYWYDWEFPSMGTCMINGEACLWR